MSLIVSLAASGLADSQIELLCARAPISHIAFLSQNFGKLRYLFDQQGKIDLESLELAYECDERTLKLIDKNWHILKNKDFKIYQVLKLGNKSNRFETISIILSNIDFLITKLNLTGSNIYKICAFDYGLEIIKWITKTEHYQFMVNYGFTQQEIKELILRKIRSHKILASLIKIHDSLEQYFTKEEIIKIVKRTTSVDIFDAILVVYPLFQAYKIDHHSLVAFLSKTRAASHIKNLIEFRWLLDELQMDGPDNTQLIDKMEIHSFSQCYETYAKKYKQQHLFEQNLIKIQDVFIKRSKRSILLKHIISEHFTHPSEPTTPKTRSAKRSRNEFNSELSQESKPCFHPSQSFIESVEPLTTLNPDAQLTPDVSEPFNLSTVMDDLNIPDFPELLVFPALTEITNSENSPDDTGTSECTPLPTYHRPLRFPFFKTPIITASLLDEPETTYDDPLSHELYLG